MALQPVRVRGPVVRVAPSARGQEVTLQGPVDVRTAPDIRLALHEAISDGAGDLYLHLGGVEIGDSTGLGVLVEAHRRARREGRRLVLASITPRTERLLRVSRLNRVLHLDPTIGESTDGTLDTVAGTDGVLDTATLLA